MKNRLILTKARRKQGGYALLLVVFLTALLVVSTASIGLKIVTEGKREKEQEMIWRGKQYTRGIKMYYRKFGRFPNSLDDLDQAQNRQYPLHAPGLQRPHEQGGRLLAPHLRRTCRQPHRQPQTAARRHPDACSRWTSRRRPRFFLRKLPGSQPAPAGGIAAPGNAPGAPGTGTGATGTVTGAQVTDTTGAAAGSQSVPPGDTPTIMGGNIIRVGSKINQSSVIVYEKAHNYRLFEFIWDPSQDAGLAAAPGTPIGTPIGTPGQNPTGSQPNNPFSPPPTPPTAAPNPNPPQQ